MKKTIFMRCLLIVYILSTSLFAITYEDAEDGSIDRWVIFDNSPTGAVINNVFDQDKESNVIEFKGSGTNNGYIIRWNSGDDAWNNTDYGTISWNMKYNENFRIYISVETIKGRRYLYYTQGNRSSGAFGQYIHHGLGDVIIDRWKNINRNLSFDLREFEPDNRIVSLNAFIIRGNGRIDDLQFIENVPINTYRPTLTITPTSTRLNSVDVEVNGKIGARVFVNGHDSGKVIGSDGKVTIPLDTSGSDGNKTFSITLRNDLNQESEALEFTIKKDTIVFISTFLNKLKSINEDFVEIEIQGKPLSKIFVDGKDINKSISSMIGVAFHDGTYSNFGKANITFDTSGEDGEKSFSIFLKDELGNESKTVEFSIIKDTIAPVAPSATSIPSTTSEDLLEIEINVESRSRVFVNGVNVREHLTSAEKVTIPLDTSGSDGEKNFSITQKDEAGNESEALVFTIIKDSRIPLTPILVNKPDVTNLNSVDVTIEGNIGTEVYVNGDDSGKVIGSDGKVTIPLDTSGSDGNKTFSITLRNDLNQESEALEFTIKKDTIAFIITHIDKPVNIIKEDYIDIEISGEVNAKIFVDGKDINKSISSMIGGAYHDGTYSNFGKANITLDTSGEDGEKSFSIFLKDELGNESKTVEFSIVKDGTAPTIPIITTIPKVTSNNSVDVEIYGEPNTKVFVNGIENTRTISLFGAIILSLNTSGADGDKNFSITLKDEAGNESESLTFTIKKDTTPPATPILTNIPNTTKADFVDVELSGEVGARVIVNNKDTNKTISSNGNVTISFDTSGDDGKKDFIVLLKDEAGNKSKDFIFVIAKNLKELNDRNEVNLISEMKSGDVVTINGTKYTHIIKGNLDFWTDNPEGDGQEFATEIFTLGDRSNLPTVTHKLIVLTKELGDEKRYTKYGIKSKVDDSFYQWHYINGFGLYDLSLKVLSEDVNENDSLIKKDENNISIVLDNNNIPYMIYLENTNSENAVLKKFNGEEWQIVGDTSSLIGSSGETSLAIDANNTPYVFYANYNNTEKAIVKKYNGSSWETVGEDGFSTSSISYPSITIDTNNTPYVLYSDASIENKATVKKFNGINWEDIGEIGFSNGKITEAQIIFDNTNVLYVIYSDESNTGKISVKKFNGTTWQGVGTESISKGTANNIVIAVNENNEKYIAYKDSLDLNKITVKKFNGTNWQNVGDEAFSNGEVSDISINFDKNDTPYVLYKDHSTLKKAIIKKFDGTQWTSVEESKFSTLEIYTK